MKWSLPISCLFTPHPLPMIKEAQHCLGVEDTCLHHVCTLFPLHFYWRTLCLNGYIPFHMEIPVPSIAWGNRGLMDFQYTFYLLLTFTDDLISCYLPAFPSVLWQTGQCLRGFWETENLVYQDCLTPQFLNSIFFHYSWHDCTGKLLQIGFPLSAQFFLHLTATRKPWISATVKFGLWVIPKSKA